MRGSKHYMNNLQLAEQKPDSCFYCNNCSSICHGHVLNFTIKTYILLHIPCRGDQMPWASEIILLHVFHILDDHESDPECDRVLENTQIQACALLELVETIDQSVSVNEKLA